MNVQLNENTTCLGCGYRLVNLPERTCPECGRSFDPSDPTTFRSSSSPIGWRRWANPPSRTECLILVGLSSYGIIGASGPAQWEAAGICMVGLIGVPLWLGLVCMSFVRLAACCSAEARARPEYQRYGSGRRWIVVFSCVLLLSSTFLHPWPMMLRFRLSQGEFDTALQDYQTGKFSGSRRVGLYYVWRVHELTYLNGRPPSIGFVTGSSFADPVGFAYDPLPHHPLGYNARRVAPSWYSYED